MTKPSAPLKAAPAAPAVASDGGGTRLVGSAFATRSPVYGARGMAATAQPLATQVAVDVLKQGGSAVDAAIAANAALGLMEPVGCGIGGDLFAIVWDPKTKRLYGYNGSGRAPAGRTLEQLKAKLKGSKTIPAVGTLPVTVPGAVDGWVRAASTLRQTQDAGRPAAGHPLREGRLPADTDHRVLLAAQHGHLRAPASARVARRVRQR